MGYELIGRLTQVTLYICLSRYIIFLVRTDHFHTDHTVDNICSVSKKEAELCTYITNYILAGNRAIGWMNWGVNIFMPTAYSVKGRCFPLLFVFCIFNTVTGTS